MAKQPTKDAPTDPLEITVKDDPHYKEKEDLSGDETSEEEMEEEEIDTSDDEEEETSDTSDDDDTSDEEDSDDSDPDTIGAGDSDEEEDDSEEDDPTPDPEKYVTIEQYKKLQSEGTKGTQKVINQVKVRDKAVDLIAELSDDHSKLLNVYEEEPEVAEYLLEKFYEGKTIQEFAKEYLGKDYTPKSKENIDPDKIKEDARKEVLKEIADKENSDYLGKLITETKVTEEQAKAIMEEFDDIVNGRTIDKTKVKKYFQSAYYSVIGKRPTNKTAKVMKNTAHRKGGGGSKKKSKSDAPKHVQESIEFLKDMGY